MKSTEDMKTDKENIELNPQNEQVQPELPDSAVETEDPIAKLEADLTESQDKYLRLYSEFENFKRRIARERVELSKMAGADLLSAILPIIDDFERALSSSEGVTEAEPIVEGMKLIYSKLKSTTEAKGLVPMNARGKTFDPELHDAISNVPAPSEDMKGKVVEEVEKGYFFNDKVIRHAKVIVGN